MWGVRFNELQRDVITMWAHARKISRAEAIRQLVERGVFARGWGRGGDPLPEPKPLPSWARSRARTRAKT